MANFAVAAPPRGAGGVSGSSDSATQREAVRAIPQEKLSPDARRKVSAVLSHVTLFRRMPLQVTRCDPRLYQFMVTHPDVTVNMWSELKISRLKVTRTGEAAFRAVAPDGSVTDFEFLYSDHETYLVYAVGNFKGPIFRSALSGGALLLLKTGSIRETDGHYYVTNRLDVFFRIDNLAADLVGRTLSPWIVKTADQNFVDCNRFLMQLSNVCATRPETIQRLAEELHGVDEGDRDRFARLAARIADEHERLTAGMPADQSSLERADDADIDGVADRTFRLEAVPNLRR